MQPVLIPGPEQIHLALGVLDVGESTYQDLGSVNAPPPLDHRDSGVGWSLQAASFKLDR
jgi:hypothetical protein